MTRSFRYSDERDFISMNQGRIYCICAFPVGAHIKILPYAESFCAIVTYDLMQFLCIKNVLLHVIVQFSYIYNHCLSNISINNGFLRSMKSLLHIFPLYIVILE